MFDLFEEPPESEVPMYIALIETTVENCNHLAIRLQYEQLLRMKILLSSIKVCGLTLHIIIFSIESRKSDFQFDVKLEGPRVKTMTCQ
jgi:hypothetical protein